MIAVMPDSLLEPTLLEKLSSELRRARDTSTAIPPLTSDHPELSLEDAYAIAQCGIDAEVGAGARVVGHKIGLTAVAVQRQLGVDTPDYGALLDSMEISNGATLSAADFIAPRIELELAFRLGSSLTGPGVTTDDVRAATVSVHPSIELVDSRIADWKITLPDTVADRASSAGFVVGAASASLDELDVTALEVALECNGDTVERGRSDAVLGDPCAAVAWLANALGEFGHTLESGEVVLSGACTRMVSISPGDHFRADFGPLGTLTLEVGA